VSARMTDQTAKRRRSRCRGLRGRADRARRGRPVGCLPRVYMLIEQVTPDKATAALQQHGGTVIKTSLSDEDTKRLQESPAAAGAGQQPVVENTLPGATAGLVVGRHPCRRSDPMALIARALMRHRRQRPRVGVGRGAGRRPPSSRLFPIFSSLPDRIPTPAAGRAPLPDLSLALTAAVCV